MKLCYPLLAFIVFGMGSTCAIADVLHTTSGKSYEGTITEEGRFYKIVRADGTKVTIPKISVKELISVSEFQSKRKAANLQNDADIAALIALADRGKFTTERLKLLQDAYELRFKVAGDDAKRLRELADWCGSYGLDAEFRLCQTKALVADFPSERKAAMNSARRLAELSLLYEEFNLSAESKVLADAALALNPEDAEIRTLLWFERDAKGAWVRQSAPWRVTFAKAKLQDFYEGGKPSSSMKPVFTVKPKAGEKIAVVTIEFEALSASTLSFKDQLASLSRQSREAAIFFEGSKVPGSLFGSLSDEQKKLFDKPSRGFVSSNTTLQLDNGVPLKPDFTDDFWGAAGAGWSRFNGGESSQYSTQKDPAVLGYVRLQNLTAAFIQPRRPVTLIMLFAVPADARKGMLSFQKLPPTEIRFE